jgi:transposase
MPPTRRYALRDDQWERIWVLLPGQAGHRGVTALDNRLFVEAVLYRYRAGVPWRDLPERFGGSVTGKTPSAASAGGRKLESGKGFLSTLRLTPTMNTR